MTKPTYEQLAAFNKKFGEIHRRFTEHHSYDDPEAVLDALQNVIFGNFPTPANPTDQFARYLASLADQKHALIAYGGLCEQDFAGIDLTEPAEQRVSQLTVLYYTTGNVNKDLAFYQRVMEARGLTVYNWFDVDKTKLRLHERCATYKAGVHRITVNLTANWSPKNGRSVDQVLQSDGPTPVGVEVFAAYALMDPEFIKCQDGEKLPYCDSAVQVRLDGDWQNVVYFGWNRYFRKVDLHSGPLGNVNQVWALPVVLQGVS